MTDHKVIMFGGKGGVGKSTCAAAAALHWSSDGCTLALSTDPTPSLQHIFEIGLSQKPARVSPSLFIDEIGSDEARKMWDDKFGREVFEVFSSFVEIGYDEFVEFITSVLPGIRDEFMVDYIRNIAVTGKYHKIVWDTAPLGQTLSLLKMPSLLGKHLKAAPRIYSKLKMGATSKKPILDVINSWETLSQKDMAFLREEVEFNIVTIPEALAVEQLGGIFDEFSRHQLQVGILIINNVIKDISSDFLLAKANQQRHYITLLHTRFPNLKMVEIPMFPHEIKGIEKLKQVKSMFFEGQTGKPQLPFDNTQRHSHGYLA
jgi:arsenite/tail-anchored protein-transporting ATPase